MKKGFSVKYELDLLYIV